MFLIMELWMPTLICVLLHAKYNLETHDWEPFQRDEKSLFKKHFLGFRAIKDTQSRRNFCVESLPFIT